MSWVDGLVTWVERELLGRRLTRDDTQSLAFATWLDWLQYAGVSYPAGGGGAGLIQTMPGSKQEPPAPTFEGYVQSIYKKNGVVFGCMAARMLLFSEARFKFRRYENGRPGELFGTPDLAILEKPWGKNSTTGDLLARAIQDVDIGGNFFAVRRGNFIYRMKPDKTVIILGSESDPGDPSDAFDARVIGYAYQRGTQNWEVLLPEEVAHYAPIPDPSFRFRGMSWVTPIINEVLGDTAATEHRLKFFENAATPNLVVSVDKSVSDPTVFKQFVKAMEDQHKGVANAYKTLYLGGGSTAQVVGANMQQMDFKVTQGHGETRIAVAARVPPIIVGLSEGLDSATYANYALARRAFADGTMRPLWRSVAGSFSPLLTIPNGAELWYDDRDIPFLQEDRKAAAEIFWMQAQAARHLTDGGWKPDKVVESIDALDIARLIGGHTGLVPVQLQPPMTTPPQMNTPAVTPPTEKPALPATTPPAEGEGKAEPVANAGRSETRPVGPFPDWASCVAAMTEEGYTQDEAEKICGSMENEDAVDVELTPRQRNVAHLQKQGMAQKQIAHVLSISRSTVTRELAVIRAKEQRRAPIATPAE